MFSNFKKAVALQFKKMQNTELFVVNVDKDKLWETYLSSFPEGTNPIYKQRAEYDCQGCKHFIRAVGNVVTIVDNKLVSLWDIQVEEPYQTVANALSSLVKACTIDNVFLRTERIAGTDKNFQQLIQEVITWEHFFVNIPDKYVVSGIDIGTKLAEYRSTFDVMLRGLTEIDLSTIDTVLELISQNSLYRGEENLFAVNAFHKLKKEFWLETGNTLERGLFCWSKLSTVPNSVSRIRNTSIGTLLVDLSEGKDLDEAVKSFESKVAPANYKRPTALVTKAMIKQAQETIEELGLTSSLERRYATLEDITINNILFADRKTKQTMNVFDEITSTVSDKILNLDKVEEVTVDNFINNILPKAESLEIMFENRHSGNLVSLIAPVNPTAKDMFKWPNGFSWSYTGEMADSIKERVKNSGGKVDGDFRASLSWFNFDDLDLHLIEPRGSYKTVEGQEIYFGNKCNHSTLGQLDVDMNAGGGNTRTPVENITYPTRSKMLEGTYKLFVKNYNHREFINIGFEVELEFDGVIYSFAYSKATRTGTDVYVATFVYSHKDGIKIVESLPSSQTSKQIWNLNTQAFHKINVVMLSPNYWDEKTVGNKHYFFMLDKCLNEGKARGFYNEFLSEELNKHRKVLEIVGSKMKTEESNNQLSGLGFSSTKRDFVLCRVKGNFNRIVKIVF